MGSPDISTEEVRLLLERGDGHVIVDALAPMVYAHSHLPGAINLPATDVDPLKAARRIPDRDTTIVVYCTNADCGDSLETAARLRELGYSDVRHYAEGKDAWRAAGLPLERAGRPYVPR
jgi:rhodanese-related sulfurtransferase